MINYTLEQEGTINKIVIPTDTSWGTICFAWDTADPFYDTFCAKIAIDGLGPFTDLLIQNPNTAFLIYTNS